MQEKKKIRIAVVSQESTGVFYHRQRIPHVFLQENYGDEFDVDFFQLKDIPKDNIVDFLKQYDIFTFHKQLDANSKIIDLIKFLGIPTVMDIDDWYKLPEQHPLHITSRTQKWHETIVDHLRKADYVTTTTPIFADMIKMHNKNIYVLPNALDRSQPQFQFEKTPSNRIRFGIVCGSTHLKDIELMKGITDLPKEIMDKITFSAHGFDYRGNVTIYNKQTGEVTKKPIEKKDSVWVKYEKLLTNDYKTVSPEHAEYLKKYLDEDDPFDNEPYRRFMTLDCDHYIKHYQNVDVLLCPLVETDFNKAKSQLKVIECAFTDTAFIGSAYGPYLLDTVPYLEKGGKVNPEGNSILISPQKNHKDWVKAIKYVVEHPECIEIMKNNLKRDIVDKYSIETVTKQRAELYRKIYQEHQK